MFIDIKPDSELSHKLVLKIGNNFITIHSDNKRTNGQNQEEFDQYC